MMLPRHYVAYAGMPAQNKQRFGVCALLTNFILVTVMVFGGVAIYLHQVKYKGSTFWYHPTDMVSINNIASDLSTVWCNAFKVEADETSTLNVYLLAHSTPVIDSYNHTVKYVNMNDVEAGAKDNSYSLLLLEGSTISVTSCRNSLDRIENVSSEILLFRGGAFQTWENNMNCKTCITKQLPVTEWCKTKKTNVFNYTVTETDTYSVVLARRDASLVGKKVYVTTSSVVVKTRYDTNDAVSKCLDVTQCFLHLDYNSDRDVIVEITDNPTVQDAFFKIQCEARVILWVAVFLLVPAFVIISLLTVLMLCELRLRRKQSQRNAESDQTPSHGYAKMNDADEL